VRILVVTQYFYPEQFLINSLVERLDGMGCKVTVITGQPNYPEGQVHRGYRAWGLGEESGGAGWRLFRVPIWPRGRVSVVGRVANYLSFVLSASLFAPFLLRGQKFDVIFVYGVSPILQAIPAILLKWLKRARLVVWVQDIWPNALKFTGFFRHPRLLSFVGALTGWIYRRSDLLLVPSRSFVAEVEARAGTTSVKFHPNPAHSAGNTLPPELDVVFPGKFNVVFAGNMGSVQGLDIALEAANLLRERKDIGFVFIGSGSAMDDLLAQAKQLELANVIFPGRFPGATMPHFYARASALLVSLVKDDDLAVILPSKVPTYLAAGRPIIAALAGEGARVITESGAGVVVPQEDPAALAAAIRDLAALPAEAQTEMASRARAYYENNFEPERLTHELIDIFKNLTAAERKPERATTRGPKNG
jgi:glycosyltransferase involved in cell wall biosynthesis